MYCVKFLHPLRRKFGFFTEGNEKNEGLPGRAVVSFLIFSLRCLPVHRLYEKADKLSREVIGAAIEVHRHRGPGLIESIYERCLLRELELRSIPATTQKLVRVEYKGLVFDEALRFDILVGDCRRVKSG
jgi:PD-(D/E)XK nuclease superfamily protein